MRVYLSGPIRWLGQLLGSLLWSDLITFRMLRYSVRTGCQTSNCAQVNFCSDCPLTKFHLPSSFHYPVINIKCWHLLTQRQFSCALGRMNYSHFTRTAENYQPRRDFRSLQSFASLRKADSHSESSWRLGLVARALEFVSLWQHLGIGRQLSGNDLIWGCVTGAASH